MQLKDKKILVTGGTGFIGEHVLVRLQAGGIAPGILVRNADYLLPRFKHLACHQVDLSDLKALMTVLSGYDIVIHLAGRTGPGHIEDPIADFQVNALGTLNLLKAALTKPVDRFVNISSCEVYGNPSRLPVTEDDPRAPIHPYGASLSAREIYGEVFFRCYGLNIITLRLFNVYGKAISPRNRKGLIPYIVDRIRSDQPLIINGCPDSMADFVYIDDVVNTIMIALVNNKVLGHIINVGSGVGTSLRDVVNTVQDMLEGKGKRNMVEFEGEKKSIARSAIHADVRKLSNLLGYRAKYSLRYGLEDMFSASQGFEAEAESDAMRIPPTALNHLSDRRLCK